MELPEFMAEASTILSELHCGTLRYPDAVDRMRDLAERFHHVTFGKGAELLMTKVRALKDHYADQEDPEDAFRAIMDCPHNEPTHYNPKGCPVCSCTKSNTPSG